MKVSFDSNVLVYTIDVLDPVRNSRAIEVVQRAVLCECVLTLQSLAELFAVSQRKKFTPVAIHAIDRLRKSFPVIAASSDCLDDAIRATTANNLSFWDAMLWATVRQAGCAILFTEDMQDGRRLGGVTFVNPFDPRNAAFIDEILPAA